MVRSLTRNCACNSSRSLRTACRDSKAGIDAEQPGPDGEHIRLLTREEFVEEVFYDRAHLVGAQIVGFNLPFDISRLAIGHVNARRSMKGGFSFALSANKKRPNVVVKHLSQRAALIQFSGTKAEALSNIGRYAASTDVATEDLKASPDRGYFVDVKTLAASLTSQSHSLESLSKLLKVATRKKASEEHGGPLTAEYVAYALGDVQTTWECFDVLAQRFATFGLTETGLYDLYSEASLGKAYLKAMKIAPWREVQPDFSADITGHILSAYFGGRSEVHIRRQPTEVLHCDFLSMYPTVCTLMGLWD